MKTVSPSAKLQSFACPRCGAFAHQTWFDCGAIPNREGRPPFIDSVLDSGMPPPVLMTRGTKSAAPVIGAFISYCAACAGVSFWENWTLIHPMDAADRPMPSEDLPAECLGDFNEAASIFRASPRGAAALLRLVIQKLCLHLGGKGKKIDDDIAYLVAEKELPERARKALDAVRVIGNNAVHPGEMDLSDDVETAIALFKAVNVIVNATITQPREMDALYDGLPERAKTAADKRDGRETT